MLLVELQSDLRAGVEVDYAVTTVRSIDGASAIGGEHEHDLALDDDLPASVRVAELIDVGAGDYLVEVVLRRNGEEVARGRVQVQTSGVSRVVTVQVFRACLTVDCADELLACRAGVCDDARCSPETPERCESPPECTVDADCPATGVACVRAVCLSSSCGVLVDDVACGGGTCAEATGCVYPTGACVEEPGAFQDDPVHSAEAACDGADDDADGSIDEGAACPCPVRRLGESSFLVCPEQRTWSEARAACQAVGYDLARIRDTPQNCVVARGVSSAALPDAWIGMSDQALEGDWRWIDGDAVVDAPWSPGEPNNNGGIENCGTISIRDGRDGQWDDRGCMSNIGYVCGLP